jgi:hypothetical protein
MLNSLLQVHDHMSNISLYNPTNYSHSLPKGLILGTTTIPTLSFKKDSTIDHELVNDNINNLVQHISNTDQNEKVNMFLSTANSLI